MGAQAANPAVAEEGNIAMPGPDVTIRPFGTDPVPPRPARPPGSSLAACALVLGPILLGSALALNPWDVVRDDGAPNPSAIADVSDGRIALAYNLGSLGIVLTIAAMIAIAVVAGREFPRAALLGAACSVAGLCSMLVNSLFDLPYYGTRDLAPQEPLTAWGQAYQDQTAKIAVYSLYPLFILGGLILAIALWRSRQVPAWAAACVLVGGFVPLAAILEVGAVAVPFTVIRVIGSLAVARALLQAPADPAVPGGRG